MPRSHRNATLSVPGAVLRVVNVRVLSMCNKMADDNNTRDLIAASAQIAMYI